MAGRLAPAAADARRVALAVHDGGADYITYITEVLGYTGKIKRAFPMMENFNLEDQNNYYQVQLCWFPLMPMVLTKLCSYYKR